MSDTPILGELLSERGHLNYEDFIGSPVPGFVWPSDEDGDEARPELAAGPEEHGRDTDDSDRDDAIGSDPDQPRPDGPASTPPAKRRTPRPKKQAGADK